MTGPPPCNWFLHNHSAGFPLMILGMLGNGYLCSQNVLSNAILTTGPFEEVNSWRRFWLDYAWGIPISPMDLSWDKKVSSYYLFCCYNYPLSIIHVFVYCEVLLALTRKFFPDKHTVPLQSSSWTCPIKILLFSFWPSSENRTSYIRSNPISIVLSFSQ